MMESRFSWFSTRSAVLLLVTLSLLVDVGVYGFIVPALPEILQGEFEASESLNGLFVALFGLGVLVGAPFSSYLSDKYRKRKLPMEIGFVTLAMSSLGIGLSKSLAQLYVSRIGQGIASGITWSIGLASIIDIYPAEKLDSPISIVYSGFTLGALGGPILGGVIFRYSGKMGMAYVMLGASLVVLVLRVLVPDSNHLRDILGLNHTEPHGSINLVCPATAQTEGNTSIISTTPKAMEIVARQNSIALNSSEEIHNGANIYKSVTYWDMIQELRIIFTCLIVIFTYGLTSSTEVIIPIVFSDRGLHADTIGYTFIAFSVPSVVGGLIIGKLLEHEYFNTRFGPHKKRFVVIMVGNVLAGILSIFLGLAKSTTLSVVLMGFIGFFVGIGDVPIIAALGAHVLSMTDSADSGANSKVYSLYNVAYSLSALIIPIIASAIFNSTNMFVSFLFLGLLLVFGTAFCMGYILYSSRDKERERSNFL